MIDTFEKAVDAHNLAAAIHELQRRLDDITMNPYDRNRGNHPRSVQTLAQLEDITTVKEAFVREAYLSAVISFVPSTIVQLEKDTSHG